MLLIYSSAITNRLHYIMSLYLNDLLGLKFKLCTNAEEFIAYSGPKFNYSKQAFSDELFFYSKSLLFEKDIRELEIEVFEWEGNKVFFSTNKRSVFPFDPFSAGFFLVTRYEEYLPHLEDKYDRFEAKESLAYQNGFLHKPVINLWASQLKKVLAEKFPELDFSNRTYQFISTLDIDNAFAYKEKGFMRNAGAFGRSLLQLNLDQISERAKVLMRIQNDPYDTYEYQLALQKKYKFQAIYFFLLADYGLNDKNLPVNSRKFQSLIKSISDYNEVGIHPGYGSNYKINKHKKEQERLENILKKDVTKSRQHFLKLTFPETYRRLIDLDVTDDYTMGYASQVGFRASICTPFYYYDLDLEIKTRLQIHPFAAMDGTLNEYLKQTPSEAISTLKDLIAEVKAVNGQFISIWHNESLSDQFQWKGWRMVYEEMLHYACN